MKNYRQGYDLTVDNAKGLIEASEFAAQAGRYGLACSLNILAAEELVKSSVIIIKHFVPNANINGYEEVFKYHKAKHKEFKMIVEFANKTAIDSDRMRKQLKGAIDVVEPIYSKIGNENQKKILEEIIENYDWFVKNEPVDFGDEDIIFEWLKIADNKKNKGLYVGENSTGWESPAHITEESFKQEKKYTMQLLRYTDWCLAILERRNHILS